MWISVQGLLPPMDGRWYLTYYPGRDPEIDITTAQGQALWYSYVKFGRGISHWMELPQKPVIQEKEKK